MINEVKLVEWECDDCNKVSNLIKQGKTPRGWRQFRQVPPYVAQCCPECAARRDGSLKKREIWKIKNNKVSKRFQRIVPS